MPGRVSWSEYSGDEVERVIAMFIATDFPTATRVTASRGDGGVDILDRIGRTAVYQVKRFNASLTGGQKKNVETSMTALVTDPRWGELEVDEWYLVMPWDPTPEQLSWLAASALERGLPKPVWLGRTHCDAWAAKYPYIVDYFFNDGQGGVQTAASRLLEGYRLREIAKGAGEVELADVRDGFGKAVEFLNERDIYFDYSFRAECGPLEDWSKGHFTDRPGLVFSVAQSNGRVTVQIDVFAKTAMSLQDNPFVGNFTIRAGEGADEAIQLEQFFAFGSPLDLPLGTVSGELEGHELLRGSLAGASLKAVPGRLADDGEATIRLATFGQDNEPVAIVYLDNVYRSHGVPRDGLVRGFESSFRDRSGCLSVLIRFDTIAETSTFRFTISRPDGVLAVDALPSLRAYAALQREGSSFVIAPQFGPLPQERFKTDVQSEEAASVELWMAIAHGLSLLQDRTAKRLFFPRNLEEMSHDSISEILEARSLLARGRVKRRLLEILVPQDEESPVLPEDALYTVELPWQVTVDNAAIALGTILCDFKGERKDAREMDDGSLADVWSVEGGVVELRLPSCGEERH